MDRGRRWLEALLGFVRARFVQADAELSRRLPASITLESAHRARVLVALVIVFNLAMVAAIPFDVANEAWGAVVLQIGWGAVCDVLLVHALRRGKIAAMGHLVSGALVVNLGIIAQEKGGLVSTEVAWQCAAIIFATLVLGPRGAFVWTFVAMASLGIHVSTFEPSSWHGRPVSFSSPVSYAIDIGFLYFATWALAYAFHRARAEFFRRLETRNVEMQRVLEHAGDALLTIDRDGRLGAERSKRADDLLGRPAPGALLWDVLGADVENFERAQWLQLGWESILEDVLPRELALEQMPRRVSFRGRTLDLRVTVIEQDTFVTGALIVLHDITEELARERAEQARREVLAVFEHVRTDPSSVASFVNEMDRLVERTLHGSDGPSLMRDIHTMKGSAALFGLESVAALCHELEDRVAKTESLPPAKDRAVLAERWRELSSELREWASALKGSSTSVPMERILTRVAQQGEALAAKLGKEAHISVDVSPPTLRVDRDAMAPVLSSLAHAVRNALDHGIEVRGSVVLRAAIEAQNLLIEVADDGAGVAWDTVRTKAEAMGRPSLTADDLVAALLSDGFSTREEVTDISGRGVGLGGIRQAAEDLGGSLALVSERGRGTRIQVRVPVAVAIPTFETLVALAEAEAA